MHQRPLHRQELKQPYADDCSTVCGFWKKIMFTTFIAKSIRQRPHSRSILRDAPLSAMKYISPSRSIIRVSWLNLRRLSGGAGKKQIKYTHDERLLLENFHRYHEVMIIVTASNRLDVEISGGHPARGVAELTGHRRSKARRYERLAGSLNCS
jgi:hypothetical protein